MSLPAMRELRASFPDASITVLAMPGIAGLYARESWANEIIHLRGGRGAMDLAVKWSLARELAARRFDAAVLFTNSFESAALVRAARIPVRIGYRRDGRRLLLTRAVPPPARGEIPRHEANYYFELLRRAGLTEAPLPGDSAVIRLEGIEGARTRGRALLANARLGGENVIGISPGAAYGTAKRWLPDRFASAAVQLARALGAQVAVFGAREEASLCESVTAMIAASGGIAVKNFAGETSLASYIDMTSACRAYLTNDSGSMHIASALAVPTVAVFGATDHVGTGPTGPLARVVRHAVDCSPYPHPCLLRECPLDHRCMKAVPADEVARTALDLLKQ